MQVFYEFRNNNNKCKFNIIDNDFTSVLLYKKHFKKVQALEYFLCKMFKIPVISIKYLESINEEDVFEIKAGNEIYNLRFTKDLIILANTFFNLCLDANNIYFEDYYLLEVKAITWSEKNKQITQEFSHHHITIRIKFQDNTIFVFSIPIDIFETYNLNIFRNLKSTDSLSNLINFYLKTFYLDQSNYDKKENITTISIWHDSLETDKVTLKNGKKESFKFQNKHGDSILSLSNNEFKITKISELDSNLNLNEEYLLLARKLQKLTE